MHLQSGLSALLAASRGETNPSPTMSVERSAITYPSIELNGESSNTMNTMPISEETSRENGSIENHTNSAVDNTNVWEESSIISDVTLDSVLLKTSIGNKKGVNGKSIFSKTFTSSMDRAKSFGTTNSDEASSDVDDTIDFQVMNNSGKVRGRSNSYTGGDNATSPNSKVTSILSANDPFPSNFTASYQVLA